MTEAFAKLSKILNLEQQKSYDNSAVIGGLEGYAETWKSSALAAVAAGSDPAMIQQIADLLVGYSSQAPEQRRSTIAEVQGLLAPAAAPAALPSSAPEQSFVPPAQKPGTQLTDQGGDDPPPPTPKPEIQLKDQEIDDTPPPNQKSGRDLHEQEVDGGLPPAQKPGNHLNDPVVDPGPPPDQRPDRHLSELGTDPGSPSDQKLGNHLDDQVVDSGPPPAQKPGTHRADASAGEAPPPVPEPATRQQQQHPPAGLDAPVAALPGISATYTSRLQKLGIATVGDLLYHFPFRYDDYTALKPIDRLEYGDQTTIVGVIWETSSRKTRGGGTVITSVIADGSGTIEAVWFNQPYLVRQLKAGRRIVLSGKVDQRLGRLLLQSPAWEPLETEQIHTGRLVPIYPLTSGITNRWMRRTMKQVVDHWAPRLVDYLPEAVRHAANVSGLSTAIEQIHYPDDLEQADRARHRLAFDEFLMIQLGMLNQRRKWQSQEGTALPRDDAMLGTFLGSLPYELTGAQRRCLDQVLNDLSKPQPMSRLLQGDVGSGKTVVAAAAMLMAVAAGKQAALMAPTEILAEQHYKTISQLFAEDSSIHGQRPISVSLLTGSLRRVQRGKVYTALASGQTDIVVGTHALIQQHVTFNDLGMVVIDEQHRFGVLQRSELRGKGGLPHTLVMSATPIPRSLALTIYGDLEVSVIDELPPGRQPIETRWLLPKERERAYAFLRSQVEAGHQAFILCPLIEGSDTVQAKAAVEEYERLQEGPLPDLCLGLLHGKLKSKEKDRVMTGFRQGAIDVLVSTSVIEVGIDVPNATVMLIEGADRFGLAQLHQFRGRVGRGAFKSYCLLLSDVASPDDKGTKSTWERLTAIEQTQDGFLLAEKDLEIRGPGDFFGVRQSGLPSLRLAKLSDARTLEQARAQARILFERDPQLDLPEHQLLRAKVIQFWRGHGAGD